MPTSERGDGLADGASCFHVVPVHTHVSLKKVVSFWPPNSSSWFVFTSYARPAPYRADGAVVGASCVQCDPSHDHVSLRGVPSVPPNSNVWPVAGSYAVDAFTRCG